MHDPNIVTSSVEFGTAVGRQVEITQTDEQHYITGLYAMNIPSPEGTSGDWHDVFHWREGIDRPRTVLLGGSDQVDTNHILGTFGVYEGRDQLVGMGLDVPADMPAVYVANHFRAILDMLHKSLTTREAVYNLTGVTDSWLDTEEQKEYVLTHAERLYPDLSDKARTSLQSWIERERRGTA